MTHEIVIKSVFDEGEEVSIENQEDDGLKVSLKDVSKIDEAAISHWLQNRLIVSQIDFERDIIYLKKLEVLNQHHWKKVDLEREVRDYD